MGTTMMGGKYFKESRVEACDCVPDEEAPARQKEVRPRGDVVVRMRGLELTVD